MANVADLQRAAEYIDATELQDGNWAHYASETDSWWVVTADELTELCEYLDSDDDEISSDAYSHWCAGTTAKEMPRSWAPCPKWETVSRMAYVDDESGLVVRIVGDVVDGSATEAELARSAPAGTSLVALECDATVGDIVVVDGAGIASEVAS